MSEEIQKVGYGYVDDTDASLKTKSGGKFGLNAGTASLVKFEHNPNSGKDKTPGDALDIAVQVGEKEFTLKVYPVTKVYDSKSVEITDTASKEYIDGYNAKVKQDNAVIIHVLKSVGVTDEQIKSAVQNVTNFVEFITALVGLLPTDFNKKPLDLFLEYQWQISDGQDRTYLQLPKNMKGGYFIAPAQEGTWEAKKEDGKLVYVNEKGTVHPFERDKNFMEGHKANQQIEGQEQANTTLAQAIPGTGQAKSGTW